MHDETAVKTEEVFMRITLHEKGRDIIKFL